MSSHESNTTRIPRKTPLNPLTSQTQKSTHLPTQRPKQKTKGNATEKNDARMKGSLDEPVTRSIMKLEEDHKRMKEILEETVKDAEEKLQYMKSLMEKSKQIHSDEAENQSNKESNGEIQEKDAQENFQGCEDTVEERQRISKARLKSMREKLKEMSNKTQMFMDDAEKMSREISEIEALSIRIDNETVEDEDDIGVVSNKDENTNFKHPAENPVITDNVFITEQ